MHRDLERELAEAFGRRAAVVFSTGYQGNLAMVGALCAAGDFVLLDADCHASLYDAARLSGATVVGFRHNAPDSLARQLGRLPAGGKNRLVIVEGLYSINGDVAPLGEIVQACRQADAYLMVDEAHSFGPYGDRGLGCAEAQGVSDDVDFVVGTFSKTLAGIGGFAVSDHPELDALHMLARPYLFTASGSPANIAGVRAALAIATGAARPGDPGLAGGPPAAGRSRRRGVPDRRHRVADRPRDHREPRSDARGLARRSRRRALRERGRPARVPRRRVPPADELLVVPHGRPRRSGPGGARSRRT